ncbi:MAG TPA: tetratricopeptide repeat protein, partial [Vicinamibacterales bacterium]|nr:tetratricopeptide repeat protein [Vicinamibacterales bacterium]
MSRSRTRRPSSAVGGIRATRRRGTAAPPGWLAVGLVCLVFAAYYPAWHGSPVWDDDEHLTRAELQTQEGLGRIWTDLGATQQYYPVTHSAFWLQHRLWGDDTAGYHMTSLALHCLSALLLFAILGRLAVPSAGLAAVLFALHPIQVESVAWITELKNTLSGALYLLAAFTYLRFDERRARALWIASFLLFLAALFAKTVTATLPAALLVIFWWQRSRLDLRRDVVPLVPFFAAGIGAGLLTGWVEHAIIGAAGTEFALSPADRVLLAGRAIWFYAATWAWPSSLVFTYPRWTIDATAWWQYVYPAAAIAVTVVLFRISNRSRAPLAAWLLLAGALVPALGFVNVYPFRYSFVADHFAYIATMPFAAATAAVVVTLLGRLGLPDARAAATVTLALGLPLWLLTFESSRRFSNAETLYRSTLAENPDSWLAHGQLGILLHQQGRLDEALSHYDRARALNPSLASAHNNACSVLWQLGRLGEARTACA